MGKPIILSDLFRQSWKSLWAQIWVLSGLLIGYVIIGLLLNAFIPPSDNHIGVAGIVIIAISVLFHLVFTLGYTKNMFQALDGEEPQFSAYGQMSRNLFIFLHPLFMQLWYVPDWFLGLCRAFTSLSGYNSSRCLS